MRVGFLARAALLLGVAALAACSGQGLGDGSNEQAVAQSSQQLSASSEATQVQQFLDQRYAKSAIRHSFKTKLGQRFDCVEFMAAPEVRARVAAGEHVTASDQPAPLPTGPSAPPRSEYELNGAPDDDGAARTCPPGTVPEVHLEQTDIARAGGLANYLNPKTWQKRPSVGKGAIVAPAPTNGARAPIAAPQGGPECTQPFGVDYPEYAHVQQTYQASQITSASSFLSIFQPAIPVLVGSHSLSQVWLYSGIGTDGGAVPGGCTCAHKGQTPSPSNPVCAQTIESGWDFNRGFGNTPVFFVFATNDGYTSGCYYGLTTCASGAPTFNAVSNPPLPLGSFVPISTPSSPQELYVSVQLVNGLWTVKAGLNGAGSTIGTFSQASFWGAMLNGAQIYQTGGEVHDPQSAWSHEMGSGVNPTAGYGNAAYVRNVSVNAGSAVVSPTTNQVGITGNGMVATQPAAYTWSDSGATAARPGGGWTNWFYYGSKPHQFWAQNYNAYYDFSYGNYKGMSQVNAHAVADAPVNTYTAQPMTGLSTYVSGAHQSHAILSATGDYVKGVAFTWCHEQNFGPGIGNNCGTSCTGSADWDYGFYKGSCASDEIAYGVAPNTTLGQVVSMWCCPTEAAGSNCVTEVINQNGGFSGHDWDYGYYKGQCPAGKYIQGISSLPAQPFSFTPSRHSLLLSLSQPEPLSGGELCACLSPHRVRDANSRR
ncbi:MAG TPA: neprosin family prolyl endopeptidase, partial [Polyangiaceae bacterium]|jgi:hypothetical protein|nr:neprosin family prolyl endopeptidase [Polyangiaceae bacterium]